MCKCVTAFFKKILDWVKPILDCVRPILDMFKSIGAFLLRVISKCFTISNAVTALVISMIILVVAVVFWVNQDRELNNQYHDTVIARLDTILTNTKAFETRIKDLTDPSGIKGLTDSSRIKCLTDSLRLDAIEELVKTKIATQVIAENHTVMDSNNYMALILTLVTLCVSLSAVIPYIVGKSISKYEIKDVVEDLYVKDKQDVNQKYRTNVNMLLASEAHFSRMMAYELVTMLKINYKDTDEADKIGKTNPIWAIGWASKALIRYITSCNSENYDSHKNFAADLLTYIQSSVEAINGVSEYQNDELGKVAKRSFIDLLNVIVYYKVLYTKLFNHEQKRALEGYLETLYAKVKGMFSDKDILKAEALKKSHYQIYLEVMEDQDRYVELLSTEVHKLS